MDAGRILKVVLKNHNIPSRKITTALGLDINNFNKYLTDNPKTRVKLSADRLQEIVRVLPDKAKAEFWQNFAYEPIEFVESLDN